MLVIITKIQVKAKQKAIQAKARFYVHVLLASCYFSLSCLHFLHSLHDCFLKTQRFSAAIKLIKEIAYFCFTFSHVLNKVVSYYNKQTYTHMYKQKLTLLLALLPLPFFADLESGPSVTADSRELTLFSSSAARGKKEIVKISDYTLMWEATANTITYG